jgi:hypothetical protein
MRFFKPARPTGSYLGGLFGGSEEVMWLKQQVATPVCDALCD